MSTVTATEARASLPELLDRVADGEEVVISRHGRAAAVLVRPDALRSRRADHALEVADEIRDLLDKGRRSALQPSGPITSDRAEELIADVQAGRNRQ